MAFFSPLLSFQVSECPPCLRRQPKVLPFPFPKHPIKTMSDGHFNRQLLPKNELTAGIRAGKAQMRVKAENAFASTLAAFYPDITAEQREQMLRHFKEQLA